MSGPFPPDIARQLMNTAASIHVAEEIKPDGTLVEGIANFPFKAVEARTGEHVQQALNYYRDADNRLGKVRLVQLLWCDKSGNYPGDPDWPSTNAQELWTP